MTTCGPQVLEFLTYAKTQAASYTTNNVIMTMGKAFKSWSALLLIIQEKTLTT